MATPNLGEISAITSKYFVPKLIDNIFNSNALLQRLKKKNYDKLDGGASIVVPVLYATTSAAGWYTGTDSLNTTANDQIDAAAFDWKQIYANITISRLDELKNSGKNGIVNFVKAKVQAAEKTMADTMGTAIFNAGTTTNALIGLRLAFQTTGYTYGSISKTTYSWWRGQADSSTATLTMGHLESQYAAASIDNDQPTVICTTDALFNSYFGILQPQQRFQDTETANGGFKNLLFRGAPVIEDSHCPAYSMFWINEDYLSLKVHADEDFRFEPFIKPTNQNVSTAKVYWTGALTCSNPRMNAWSSALTA